MVRFKEQAGVRRLLSDLQAFLSQRLRRAWLVGGGELAGAFRAEGLIAEYIISVIPVMLGKGIQLFGGNGAHEALTLVESQRYASGIVQLRYVRGR